MILLTQWPLLKEEGNLHVMMIDFFHRKSPCTNYAALRLNFFHMNGKVADENKEEGIHLGLNPTCHLPVF